MIRRMFRAQQLLAPEVTEEVLLRNNVGTLCVMGDDDFPYGVPMNYAYKDGKIYFHSARRGYKTDCLEIDQAIGGPKCSFTVIDYNEVEGEKYSTLYRSVIAMGRVRKLDGEEKIQGFRALVDSMSSMIPEHVRHAKTDACTGAWVYAIDIEHLTGKEAKELMMARKEGTLDR